MSQAPMPGPVEVATPPVRKISHLRWYICGLLFFATTVNYVDRQVLGILKPVLSKELGWNEAEYGWVVFGFQLAYALLMPIAGRLLDWLGTRLGYAIAVTIWSLAAMSHSLASNAMQFAMARFALGVGEAGNFPAAVKTVADWFPKRERALATGIFNSGSNVGAIVAPLTVPWVAATIGWRFAFLTTGFLELAWLAAWLVGYRKPEEHPRLKPEELALIQSDRDPQAVQEEAPVSYLGLLRQPETWALMLCKFLTDPVWWFYLYWLPGFLFKSYGLNLTALGLPLITIYLCADVGSVGGGWLSSTLLKHGWDVNRARKTAMLVCAIAVVPVGLVHSAGGQMWLAVALVSLAASAHQGWSANLYTLVSDLFPAKAVASVVGLAGFGGAIGGMIVAPALGYYLDWSHQAYGPVFIGAGLMYLIALGIFQLVVPRIRQIRADKF